MEIPYQQLSSEALHGIIEEFITREGTEYGERDYSLEAKVAQVIRQLERGEVVIHFDDETQSCTLQRTENKEQRTDGRCGGG